MRAEYTYFKPAFKRVGLTLDDDVWRRISADLALVVDGIESGVYPAVPRRRLISTT